jgi:hypothetical protein
MTSQSHFARPPRVAVWLLSLFAFAGEAESILGDLLEEFSLLAFRSGVASARKWYWRQTIRTVPQLAGVGLRNAPWLTVAAVVGGFCLRKLVGPLVTPAIFAVIERYQLFFQHHFGTYLFLVSTGIDIVHTITFLFIGFVVAFVARRNEMVATIALALFYAALAVVASVYVVARTGNDALLWRLTWYFADSFAIVVAGAILRAHRLASHPSPPKAPGLRNSMSYKVSCN